MIRLNRPATGHAAQGLIGRADSAVEPHRADGGPFTLSLAVAGEQRWLIVRDASGQTIGSADLDTSAGVRATAMRLILSDPSVRAILVNIFGGIARGDEVARGLVEARSQQQRHVPMVVRIVGTNAG